MLESELETIIESLPRIPENYGDALSAVKQAGYNAKVFYNARDKKVEIFPLDGGWIACDVNFLEADIAPFSD